MFHEDIMCAMDVDSTAEAVMYGAASHVWPGHVTIQMEVDGIAAKAKCLAGVGDFDVLKATSDKTLVFDWGVKHDLGAKLIRADVLAKAALEACLCHKLTCKQKSYR